MVINNDSTINMLHEFLRLATLLLEEFLLRVREKLPINT